jgi:uncharacterized protein (DUF433 family)
LGLCERWCLRLIPLDTREKARKTKRIRIDQTRHARHIPLMSAPTTVEIGTLISRTPGIKGGTPHLTGTGVTVRTIVRWHRSGLMPEEIAIRIGHISLSQVHAALAFYYANQKAMDHEMAEEEAESDRIEREHLKQHRQRPSQS